MVTVVGDAGVGKSRLLSDFGRWLDELPGAGVVVRRTGGPLRAEPALRPAPRPVRHPLRHPRQRRPVRGSAQVGARRRAGARHGPETRRQGPPHRPAGSASRSATSRSLDGLGHDPQNLSGRATADLAEYFRRLAEQAPVVLLLEDLHWADEATLALINAADAVLRDCPVLVVATTRPTLLERHPHWGEGLDFHTRLPLRSLSRRETRRLLDEILKRADHVPAALSDLVVMASEGNPFYVEELVNWFLEADVITRDGDVWHVVEERLEQAQVPATLRSVLQARLDALSTAERLTLQRASVIGRVFWDDAVESLRGRRRPTAPPTDDARPARPSTGCAGARSSTSGRSRRSTTTGSSCSSTPCCATSPTRACCAGTAGPTTGSPPAGSSRWPSAPAGRTSTPALIADHHANSGDREAAARWYLIAGQQAASVHGLADARRLLDAGHRPRPRGGRRCCASTC